MSRFNARSFRQWDQVICPECQNDLDLQQDDVDEGEIVCCTNCGSEFEVMTHPFELRLTRELHPEPNIQRHAA